MQALQPPQHQGFHLIPYPQKEQQQTTPQTRYLLAAKKTHSSQQHPAIEQQQEVPKLSEPTHQSIYMRSDHSKPASIAIRENKEIKI